MRKIEQLFTTLTLLYFTGGLYYVWEKPSSTIVNLANQADQQSAGQRFFVAFIYLITCIVLAVNWKKVLPFASKFQVIWILVGIAVASNLWSLSPSVTKVRTLRLLGTTLFSLYFTSRYSLRQQILFLGRVFWVEILLSIIFALFLPVYGRMPTGEWRGIFVHKNVLGEAMTFCVVVFLFLLNQSSISRRRTALIFLVLSFIVLAFSQSITSISNSVALLLSYAFLRLLNIRNKTLIPLLCFLIVLIGGSTLWVYTNIEALLGALGRDLTLTGRVDLWHLVWLSIQERPLFGYGYDAFWTGADGPSALIWQLTGWEPPNAHNGWLDLWLSLGLVTVLLLAIVWVISFLKSVIWMFENPSPENLWPATIILSVLLMNFTESNLMRPNLLWLLYVSSCLTIFSTSRSKATFKDLANLQRS